MGVLGVTLNDSLGYESLSWFEQAVCQEFEPEWWFPTRKQGLHGSDSAVQRALSVCSQCSVAQQCREFALKLEWGQASGTRFGIFGGMLPEQRYVLSKVLTYLYQRLGLPTDSFQSSYRQFIVRPESITKEQQNGFSKQSIRRFREVSHD